MLSSCVLGCKAGLGGCAGGAVGDVGWTGDLSKNGW